MYGSIEKWIREDKKGTCRFLVFDFDDHEKDERKERAENTNADWKEEVDALRRIYPDG